MLFTFTDNSPEVLGALDAQVKNGLTICGLVAEGYAKSIYKNLNLIYNIIE